MPLFNDRDKHINRDGNPDLALHGIHDGPVNRLDPEVLLDPFEEQFHLPSGLIQQADCQRRKIVVVDKKTKMPLLLFAVKANTPEWIRVVLPRRFGG